MRYLTTLCLIFIGQAAAAHPGHLADVAGHDHWVAGAAIGLAVLAGLWGALKGTKDTSVNDDADGEEIEGEAA